MVTWSSSQMRAEVQGWLADSAQNFGWIILGDENGNRTARRMHAREGSSDAKPVLHVYYKTTSVSVKEDLSVFSRLTLFPNPSQGRLSLQLETLSTEEIHTELINMIGQAVYRSEGVPLAGKWTQAMNLTHLPAGVYFLKIRQGDQLAVRRWIKE